MTTFRRPLKPLPVVRLCPVCLGWRVTLEDIKAHNLASASHGERIYRGPRL